MVTQAIFRALDDPIRREIVRLLVGSRLSVTEIASHFTVSRPAVSRHLRVLKQGNLVTETRSGRERLYRLRPETLIQAAAWLSDTALGRTPVERHAFSTPVRDAEIGRDATRAVSSTDSEPGDTEAGGPEPGDWREW